MKKSFRRSLPALLCLTLILPTFSRAADEPPALSADAVLAKLVEGNKRFVAGTLQHPDQDAARRVAQSKGQSPTAIVLTCADSRVSPEICFVSAPVFWTQGKGKSGG